MAGSEAGKISIVSISQNGLSRSQVFFGFFFSLLKKVTLSRVFTAGKKCLSDGTYVLGVL